jgi:hypothetical protein
MTGPYYSAFLLLCVCLCLLILLTGASEAEKEAGAVALPRHRTHPYLACTVEELARLKTAYAGAGEEGAAITRFLGQTERTIAQPLVFPPRGGQHNQWYQCAACEVGLTTIDATHHRCPKCGKVYSGEPYDDAVFKIVHSQNLSRMYNAAWAYAITGKRPFADFAAHVLRGYAERYRTYPYHSNKRTPGPGGGHLFEQSLTEAANLAENIAPAYDLLYDSGALTAADHALIREGLLLPMLAIIGKEPRGMSNWQSWHNAAMLTGGALLGDEAWVRRALYDPKNGFVYQLTACVTAEGMWHENSWGYHFYTLRALTTTAEWARRLGIPLWEEPRFQRMFTLPAHYLMPDGALPRLGDDPGGPLPASTRELFETAYHATQNPELLPMLSTAPTMASIVYGRRPTRALARTSGGSRVLPEAGHAILRSPGPAGLTAVMSYGPYGGAHGHFDKLSFVFYGYGQELGVDPGRAASQAYGLPIHTHWYKATLGHNAVVVERTSQHPTAGKLLKFATAAELSAVSARCDTAYPGVSHTRTLVLRPSYLLVIDELTADTARRFDWLYHGRADTITSPTAQLSLQPEADYPGVRYLQGLRGGTTEAPIQVTFTGKAVTTTLTVAAAPETGLLLGDGPGQSVLERIPLAMLTRRGARVRFVAVLAPIPTGRPPTVTGVSVDERDGGVAVQIRQGAQGETVTVAADKTVALAR